MPHRKHVMSLVTALMVYGCFSTATVYAQSNYVSPFGTGSLAPNITVAPSYGYGGYPTTGYQVQGPIGNGAGNVYGQPQAGFSQGQSFTGNNQSGNSVNGNTVQQQGGASAATPAPVAGASAQSSTTSGTTTAANPSSSSSAASPTAAARGSIREGDTVRGTAYAVSGNTITVEGVNLSLSETSSPAPEMLCASSGSSTWKCGEQAKTILNRILSYGPVRCTLLSVGSPSTAKCLIGRDDVSQLAVQEGAALSAGIKYRAYSFDAMNDKRGIWAHAGR